MDTRTQFSVVSVNGKPWQSLNASNEMKINGCKAKQEKKNWNWKRFRCELHIAQTQTNNDTLTHSAVVVVAFHPRLRLNEHLHAILNIHKGYELFFVIFFHLFYFIPISFSFSCYFLWENQHFNNVLSPFRVY